MLKRNENVEERESERKRERKREKKKLLNIGNYSTGKFPIKM